MAEVKSSPSFFWCSLSRDPATAAVVRHLQEQGLLVADHSLRRGEREIVAVSDVEVQLLKDAGVPFDLIGPIVRHQNEALPPRGVTEGNDALATGFVNAYLDGAQIVSAVAALHATFPALTQLIDLPELTSGYDGSAAGLVGPAAVKLLRITTTPAVYSKPGILIVAGLHAREWAPPLAAIEFASQLLNNYSPGSVDPDVVAINELVDNLDILVVAAGNPDGINYSHHDDAMWRKNRRVNAGFPACPGVDNNRNFSIYWGQAGSSSSPCDYQIFRGPSSFSEVENRNVRNIVEMFPNILTAIDCHSFGEEFLRPQPTGGSFISSEPVPAADHAIYLGLEAAMNTAVGTVTAGKHYSTGTTSNHAGTFDEYMYFGHRIFAFEVEIGAAFQPPLADALVSVQEAGAAIRALARETRALAARFTTPASIVQVIDKSSSMVASGYVDATIGNAHRFIDLMGLNDATGVVSFNHAAMTNLPLTTISAPSVYATAHAAVSGIVFGGSTSIGAGLQAALAALAPAPAPRSILLLSDGYENTVPMVSLVLPTVPGDVHVHTIALGAASDQALLQSIATATGGSYFFSPDELGLFEIYNVARAASADNDLMLEETVDPPPAAHASNRWSFSRLVVIDDDAAHAEFSVATLQRGVEFDVALRAICPTVADLGRTQRRAGVGYQVLRLRRPQPGTYELTVTMHSGSARCSVAAYVTSPLRLRLGLPLVSARLGAPIDLGVTVTEGREHIGGWSVSARALVPTSSLRLLNEAVEDAPSPVFQDRGDRVPEGVTRALAIRDVRRRKTGNDPLRHDWKPVHAVHPAVSTLPPPGKSSVVLRVPTSSTIDGSYNVRVEVHGHRGTGHPFVRVGLRSVHRA
jgi:hypothetical protein